METYSTTFFKTKLDTALKSFLNERKVKGCSINTMKYYSREIGFFLEFLRSHGVNYVEDITPNSLRAFLEDLSTHRNQGGVHGSYRAIKAYLLFFENEFEPEDWKNPIRKVKVKAPPVVPLKGITPENVHRLVEVSDSPRDRAIFLCLASSGCRANEFLSLNLEDIDFTSGAVRINHGKGDKARTTFLSKEARSLLKKYLRTRTNLEPQSPLWLNRYGERMNIQSLRLIVDTTSAKARIPHPKLHDFRRCFAITLFRSGAQVLSISMLLGHTSVEITKRYLDIQVDDLRAEHGLMNL